MKLNVLVRPMVTGALLLLLIVVSAFVVVIPTWNPSKDYSIKFSGRKAEGNFTGLKGQIQFNQDDLANSHISVSVDVKTIATGNDTKDEHARNKSWLDAAQYPTISFTSVSFKKQGEQPVVNGKLTMHGVTKDVVIPYQFVANGRTGVFTGSFTINRKDYGIKGNTMGFLVGDEFAVSIKLPVLQQ